MEIFATVLITLLVINALVLAHEWGHYTAAKRLGIPVIEFSIGFGPRLLRWHAKNTVYSFRILPLGGYVLMDSPELNSDCDPAIYTPAKKMGLALGGPLANIFMALFIFMGIYCMHGIPAASTQPVIGQVINEKPAQQAGIKPGDVVLSVNSHPVHDWAGLTGELGSLALEEKCRLEIQRDGKMIRCSFEPYRDKTTSQILIGVQPQIEYQKQGLWAGLAAGCKKTMQLSNVVLSGFVGLATGAFSVKELAGPIGMAGMVGSSLANGWLELLAFTAFLSINLGIFNLLPVPFLDGSRMILAGIEALRRRALAPEKEAMIHLAGLALLMVLMLYSSYNDILRLFG